MIPEASRHILSPSLLGLVIDGYLNGQTKSAFIPTDPSGGGMPMGAPPADPAGGMPPEQPPAGGNPGGGLDAMQLRQILSEYGLGTGGQGGGAAGGQGLKPKIDVNVEIMQIKNMQAKMLDAMGIPIPAQDMVATPEKLNAMAAGQPTSTSAQTGAGGQSGPLAPIQPIQPMGGGQAPGGKMADDRGVAFDTSGISQLASTAQSISLILARRKAN